MKKFNKKDGVVIVEETQVIEYEVSSAQIKEEISALTEAMKSIQQQVNLLESQLKEVEELEALTSEDTPSEKDKTKDKPKKVK